MDGHGQSQIQQRTGLGDLRGCGADTGPMSLLAEAFESRRIMRHREGNVLRVNDPYLRESVVITWTERGYCWMSPGQEPCFGDPGRVAEVVETVILQYAGNYMVVRRLKIDLRDVMMEHDRSCHDLHRVDAVD